jgi:putative ABC transport system permease protein
VEPKSAADIQQIQKQVQELGYLALTREQFEERISHFYIFQTGLGMNIMLMTTISFIVGVAMLTKFWCPACHPLRKSRPA